MDSHVLRGLVQYLHELRSRNRNYYRTSKQSSSDSKSQDDSTWDKGDWGGDGRRNKHETR